MSSDQESRTHYTVDEMMDALKTGGRSGKRKRRSKQPLMEVRRRRRRFWILFGSLAALVIGGIVLLSILSRSRIGGEHFRQTVSQRIGDMLGTEVEFDRFRPSGLYDLECSTVRLKGRGGVFRNALFSELEADLTLGSFFNPEWHIQQLRIGNAEISFQSAGRTASTPYAQSPGIDLAKQGGIRMGLSPDPAFISVDSFSVNKMTVRIPDSRGGDLLFENMKGSGRMIQNQLNFQASSGRLAGAVLPDLPIQSVALEIDKDKVEVLSAVLALTEKAQLSMKGGVMLTPQGSIATLDVRLTPSVLFEELFSPLWANRIACKISLVGASYNMDPTAGEEISGAFSLEGCVVQGFPFQSVLCNKLKTELHQKLEFRQFSGRFRRLPDRLILEDLKGNRQGESRLFGTVTCYDDKRVEGKLTLHLNTPLGEADGFKQEDDLDIFEINLSGTAEALQDDLAAKWPASATGAATPPATPAPAATETGTPEAPGTEAPAPVPSPGLKPSIFPE